MNLCPRRYFFSLDVQAVVGSSIERQNSHRTFNWFRRFFLSLRSSIDSKAFHDTTVNFSALSAIGIVLTKSLSRLSTWLWEIRIWIDSNILHESSNVSVQRSTCTHPHRLSTLRNQSRVSAHLSSLLINKLQIFARNLSTRFPDCKEICLDEMILQPCCWMKNLSSAWSFLMKAGIHKLCFWNAIPFRLIHERLAFTSESKNADWWRRKNERNVTVVQMIYRIELANW